MARRKLSKDVSTQEMLYMRTEKNMSVKEIAESLDVSVKTVYRYIGPSGKKKSKSQTVTEQTTEKTAEVGSVGQAMFKAFNARSTTQPNKSMNLCSTCVNRGVGCSLCLRNPLLKDYYAKENGK